MTGDRLFDLLAPADGWVSDWPDVLERAGVVPHAERRSRRRVWIAVAIFVVLIAVAAPALGFQPGLLDFFSSKHASKRVVHRFSLMNVGAPRGMSPGVIAGQTRLITTYHLRSGKPFRLWVAPARSGGFCFLLGYGGGCVTRKAADRVAPGDQHSGQFDVSRLGSRIVAGSVVNERTARLEVRFLHGKPEALPLLWVGAPIDRGFFLYELTRREQSRTNRVTAIVALDGNGRVLAQIVSIFRPPPAWSNPNNVSSRADRHVILRSGDLSIAIAPSQTGGTCWWLRHRSQTVGSGCAPRRFLMTAMVGGQNHGSGFTSFSAQVKPNVNHVVLRFQDGATATLRPVQGYVLYNIPETHWPRGHRLTLAAAYSATGDRLTSENFDPLQVGVYDCKTTIPIGAGQRACP